MLRIPVCFMCKNYEDGKCPAFPGGIPDEFLFEKKMDEDECADGVVFVKDN